MTFEDFLTEYTKLYRFFYSTSEPHEEQISEYFEFLRYLPFAEFKIICSEVKQHEDNIPRNLVAYCKKFHGSENLRGEMARGGNAAKNPHDDPNCFACLDTGFIGFYAFVDRDTGRKTCKIRGVDDHGGVEFVKRCLCPAGQRMAGDVWQATQKECGHAAQLNNGHPAILAAVPF